MNQRNHQHSEHVPTFKNINDVTVWLNYLVGSGLLKQTNGNLGSKDQNITSKLFDMMEKVAHLLSQMEILTNTMKNVLSPIDPFTVIRSCLFDGNR